MNTIDNLIKRVENTLNGFVTYVNELNLSDVNSYNSNYVSHLLHFEGKIDNGLKLHWGTYTFLLRQEIVLTKGVIFLSTYQLISDTNSHQNKIELNLDEMEIIIFSDGNMFFSKKNSLNQYDSLVEFNRVYVNRLLNYIRKIEDDLIKKKELPNVF